MIFIIQQKYEYLVDADKQVAKFRKQFAKGLFTDMKNILRLLLFETMLKIELNIEKIMNAPANTNNSVIIMANSGNVSQFTNIIGIMDLLIVHITMNVRHVIKDTIEVPIKDSLIDSLTFNEYYNSSCVSKGMADIR